MPGWSAFSMTSAIASGALAMNEPVRAVSPIRISVSLSRMTTRRQGCWMRELGAQRAALRSFPNDSSETGSGLNSRTVRRVLRHS